MLVSQLIASRQPIPYSRRILEYRFHSLREYYLASSHISRAMEFISLVSQITVTILAFL